ncbi:MAG: hypothetical protein KKB59_18670 [Spirochaetes bacterium]|nr:hypothetical protein [Spirochaetota bacterium]
MTETDVYNQCRTEVNSAINEIYSNNSNIKAIYDGIIDTVKYYTAKYRILWILKEPNDLELKNNIVVGGGWDLCDVIKNISWLDQSKKKNGLTVFRRLSQCSNYILNTNNYTENYSKEEMWQSFKSTAYINIKKTPGGKNVSNYEIQKAYIECREILHKQIESINPQIIIGCNTLSYFSSYYEFDKKKKIQFNNLKLAKKGYYINNDKLFIDISHPLKHGISDMDYLNSIREAVLKWEDFRLTIAST